MALKDLYTMAKADRYTADGREALIKAQETEDARRYQNGEISEKTGLMKTPNGWVEPPKGKQPGAKKENPTRTFVFKNGPDGMPVAGSGKEVKTYKTKKEAEAALKKQNAAAEKPESKPAAQEEIGKFYTKFKDAQSAYDAGRQTFPEGGYKIYNTPQGYKVVDDPKTQQRMEAAGYEVEVDVPEGTKPPKSSTEKKPAAGNNLPDIPDFKGMESGDYDKKLRAEGWTTGGWEGNGTHASAIFKKGDRTIRVNEGQPGKITSVQEISKPAAENKSATRQRGEQLAQPAEKRQSAGYQHWQGVMSGYSDGSLLEQRKQLQESVDEFEDDLKDYDRRGLASAAYGKRIDQKNWQIGALKAIDEEMERRGMDPAPRTSVPDSAPRVLTGDTRIRVRK